VAKDGTFRQAAGVAAEATSGSQNEPDAAADLRAVREILRGHIPLPVIDEDTVVTRVRSLVSREITAYHREILEGLSELRGSLTRLDQRVSEL
jgi:hypothetical protein